MTDRETENHLGGNEKSLLKQINLFEEAFAKGGNSDKLINISYLWVNNNRTPAGYQSTSSRKMHDLHPIYY